MESQKIMESQKLKELQNQRAKALEKLKKACRECSPKRRKSEFVTCPKCGSRYPRKYILECGYTCYPCRVCEDRRSLYSATFTYICSLFISLFILISFFRFYIFIIS